MERAPATRHIFTVIIPQGRRIRATVGCGMEVKMSGRRPW